MGASGKSRGRRTSLHCRVLLAAVVLGAGVAAWPARAIPPPLTDEQLVASADLIATGTVQGIKERDEVSHPYDGSRYRTMVMAYLTVTVRVQGMEKGSMPPGNRTVCFIVEQFKVRPKDMVGGPISPPDLRVGNRVKVFLPSNEAGCARIYNGQDIQVLP